MTDMTKTELITALQSAAKRKGATPTAQDADRRRYNLPTKTRFTEQFGSWNNAIRAADLPVNKWRGDRNTPTNGDGNNARNRARSSGPIGSGHDSMVDFIEARLREEREEVAVLERVLETYRRTHATA